MRVRLFMCLGPYVPYLFNVLVSFACFMETVFHWTAMITVGWESRLHLPGLDIWASPVACGVTAQLAAVGVGVTLQWVWLEVKYNAEYARTCALIVSWSYTDNRGSVTPCNKHKKNCIAISYSSPDVCCWDSSVDCASTPASAVSLSIAASWSWCADPVADYDMLRWDISGSGALVEITIMPSQLSFPQDERWIDCSCSTSLSSDLRAWCITGNVASAWVHNLLS